MQNTTRSNKDGNNMGKIYKHILSMRERTPAMPFDKIRHKLLSLNFPEDEVEHAIAYRKGTERVDQLMIDGSGELGNTIGVLLGGAALAIVGAGSLVMALKYAYIFFFVPVKHNTIGWMNAEGVVVKGALGYILAIIIFSVVTLALPMGVLKILDQIDIRKKYIKRKKQGLLDYMNSTHDHK